MTHSYFTHHFHSVAALPSPPRCPSSRAPPRCLSSLLASLASHHQLPVGIFYPGHALALLLHATPYLPPARSRNIHGIAVNEIER